MKISILNKEGNPVEIDIEASIYREAHDNNISVAQLLERKFGADVDAKAHGSVFEQVCASSGLVLRADQSYGLRVPSIQAVMEGQATFNAGVIVREASPVSRIVFPAVILEMMENVLTKDFQTTPQAFEQMIAISDTIAGTRFEQPIIDLSRPEGARSQGITQGALPSVMMHLKVSDAARSIPGFSIGLEMTDEAAKSTSLDFVTLSLRRQFEAERDARTEGYISSMLAGDADLGMAALSTINQTDASLDASAASGTLTQLAWVKWLYRNYRKRRIDYVICDIATAIKIEGRTNKPTADKDDPKSPRIDALFSVMNPGIANVKLFLVETGVVPANTIMGIDSRYAIRRVRNSEAQYQAAENFVMKKTSQMRFDFGEICYRLYDDAFDALVIV